MATRMAWSTPQLSKDAADLLAADGFDVSLHFSPGVGHGIAPDGLEFATSFLLAQPRRKDLELPAFWRFTGPTYCM